MTVGSWTFTLVDHWTAHPPFDDTSTYDNSEFLARDGTLTTAGDTRIEAAGQRLTRVGADGTLLWRHDCAGLPRLAHVSGDRLLVLTNSLDYHPWGHLGPALLLDLHEGRLVAELRGERGVPMGDGRFLVGLEGYDVFDTWLHDRDGTLVTSWRSYGHYIADPGPTVRVIECDRRIPSSAHIVRLLPDGGIERGPSLSDGQVPTPAVLADGTAMVLDAGVLRSFDRNLRGEEVARLLSVEPDEKHRFPSRLRLEGDRLTVTSTELVPRSAQAHRRHQWVFACHRAGR